MLEGKNSHERPFTPPVAVPLESLTVAGTGGGEITVPGYGSTPAKDTHSAREQQQAEITSPATADDALQHGGNGAREATAAPVETAVAPRRRGGYGPVRLRATEKPIIPPGQTVPIDREHNPGIHPVPGDVAAATRRGRRHELGVIKSDPNGETILTVTPSLLPPGNVTLPLESTAEAGGSPSESRLLQRLQSWGILFPTSNRVVDENISEDQTQDSSKNNRTPMNITNHHRQHAEPNAVFLLGDPVTDQQLQPLVDNAFLEMKRAESRPSMAGLRPEQQKRFRELTSTLGNAAVREFVVVGAVDDDALDHVANTTAGQLLSATNRRGWAPVDEVIDGERYVVSYPTKEAAVAAVRNTDLNPETILPAKQFADEIMYPPEPIPGVVKTYETNFAAEGPEVRPGEKYIELAKVLYRGLETDKKLTIEKKIFGRHGLIIGATGSGKSEFEMQLATKAAESAHREAEKANTPINYTTTIFDGEKRGSFDDLGNRFAGLGFTPEQSTVHIVDPAREGVLPTIDPLRITGNTTAEQRSVAVQAFGAGVTEGDAFEVFTKYMGKTIDVTGTWTGWGEKFACDTAATPTQAQLEAGLTLVAATSDFSDEIKGNVSSFNENTFEKKMRESLGFLGDPRGYPVDWFKINHCPGATVIQLGSILDEVPKAAVMTVGIRGIRFAHCFDNGGKDVKEPNQLLLVDEPGMTLGNTEVGRQNAKTWEILRGEGGTGYVGVQGNLEDRIHDTLAGNTINTYAFLVPQKKDREFIAGRTGRTTVEDLTPLASSEVGKGVYFGPRLEKVVEIQTLNPEDPAEVPRGEGLVVGPEAVLDMGHDRRFYTKEEKEAGEAFLNTPLGNQLIEWTEINAPLVLNNHPIVPISGAFKKALNEVLENDVEPAPGVPSPKTAFEVALDAVTGDAADSRKQIMHFMKRIELSKVLRDEQEKNIPYDAPEPELPPKHVVYPHARLNPVRNVIMAKLTPPPLPGKEFIGYGPVPGGTTAIEQEGNTIKTENQAASRIKDILEALVASEDAGDDDATGALVDGARDTLLHFIADVPEGTGRAEYIADRIRARAAHTLTTTERDILESLTTGLEARPDEPRFIGYEAMRLRVGAYIRDFQKQQGPMNLDAEGERYGRDFNAPTLLQQLKLVEEYTVQEIRQTGNKEIILADDLFARDRRNGRGFTIDNTVGFARANAEPHGEVHTEQRNVQNKGKKPDLSLLNSLSQSPEEAAKAWNDHVTKRFIYPVESRVAEIKSGVPEAEASVPDYLPQPAAKDFMAMGYGENVRQIKEKAMMFREAEKILAERQKGKAAA